MPWPSVCTEGNDCLHSRMDKHEGTSRKGNKVYRREINSGGMRLRWDPPPLLPPPPLRTFSPSVLLKTFRISVVIERIAPRSPIWAEMCFLPGMFCPLMCLPWLLTRVQPLSGFAFRTRSLNARVVYPPLWLLCIPRNRNWYKYVIY